MNDPRDRSEIETLTEIQVLADAVNEILAAAPDPNSLFPSGILLGLAMAVQIIYEGSTAEQQLDGMNDQLAMAFGRLYLEGKLPPAAPGTEPTS